MNSMVFKGLAVCVGLLTTSVSANQLTLRYHFARNLKVHTEGAQLSVSYERPCATQTAGVFVSEPEPAVLELGVVLRQSAINCARLPDLVSEKIDWINLKRLKEIRKLTGKNKNTELILRRPLEYQLTKSNGRSSLQSLVHRNCRERVGFILRRNLDFKIEFSNLVLRKKRFAAHCYNKPHLTRISHLSYLRSDEIELVDKPTQQPVTNRSLPSLRLAQVASDSLRTTARRDLSLRYRRRCNEAPVGVVITRQTDAKSKKQFLEVAMLVARHPNINCHWFDKTWFWESYQNHHVSLSVNQELRAWQSISEPGAVSVVPPKGYSIVHREKADHLALEFYGGCRLVLGAVYAEDNYAHLSVGILVSQKQPDCAKQLKQRTLIQPHLLANRQKPGKLFPLRVNF